MLTIKSDLSLEDFKEMSALELQYYDESFVTPAEESYLWYKHASYSIRAVYDFDQLVGFMNFFPISESLFNHIKTGHYNDQNLTYKDIEALGKSKYLFLSCIVINESYRKTNALQLLLDDYNNLYKGYDYEFIITDNVTEAGIRFSRKLGLTPYKKTSHNSTLCIGLFKDFLQKEG